jgi:hypothetical protein
MANVFVRPAMIELAGVETLALVRDPVTFRPLKAEGENKPKTQFWLRRIRDFNSIPGNMLGAVLLCRDQFGRHAFQNTRACC